MRDDTEAAFDEVQSYLGVCIKSPSLERHGGKAAQGQAPVQ